MRGRLRFLAAGALTAGLAALLPGAAQAQGGGQPVNVQQAAGTSVAAIQSAVDAYRNDLGTLNAAGPAADGRREIGWDGVPDARSAPNLLPADFFAARGVVFSTNRGSRFQVSANAGVAPVEFDNLNPTYSRLFAPFSPQRLFTALDTNKLTVNFFVPGTQTRATSSGFGAVFTDVDRYGTRITYYDARNRVLGTFPVPISPGNETLSFLGVRFLNARVARVKITSGNTKPGLNETRGRDVVVMDDFIFGEPTS
ncbi:MAG: hypothetical protein ACRDLN_12630 [Solirubrobacteraceae bacterium]